MRIATGDGRRGDLAWTWFLQLLGSWNLDAAHAGRGRALRDVEREQRERLPLAVRLDPPPDRVVSERARRERHPVAQRAVMPLEGGEYDAALVWLVARVVEQHERPPAWLARAPRRPADGNGAGGVSLAGVEVPRAVAAALTDELALLPDDARRVLDGAAIAGDPFEPELAAAAAGLDEARVIDALDELLRSRPRPGDRRAAPLPLPPPARPRRGLRGRARRVAAAAPTNAAPTLLAAHGAPALSSARTTSSAPRRSVTSAAVAVLREAGEAAARHAPATAAALFAGALRLLRPAGSARAEPAAARRPRRRRSPPANSTRHYVATIECLELLPPDDLAPYVRVTAACGRPRAPPRPADEAHTRLWPPCERLADRRSPEAVTLMIVLADRRALSPATTPPMSVVGATCARRGASRSAIATPASPAAAGAARLRRLRLSGAVADAGAARVDEAAALVDGHARRGAGRVALEHGGTALAAAELYLGRYEDAGRARRAGAWPWRGGQGRGALLAGAVLGRARSGGCAAACAEAAEMLRHQRRERAALSGHASALAWSLSEPRRAGDLGRRHRDRAAHRREESRRDAGERGTQGYPRLGGLRTRRRAGRSPASRRAPWTCSRARPAAPS